MILFEKFGQHQPLNRQSERYRREGIDLRVSTLADQVGACTPRYLPDGYVAKVDSRSTPVAG
jgi:transposase